MKRILAARGKSSAVKALATENVSPQNAPHDSIQGKTALEAQLWTERFFVESKACLKQFGYAYIQDLPADFQWIGFVQHLTQTQLMPQDNGEYISDIKSVEGNELLSDSKSQNELRPHTDASYYHTPNKYQALWCVQPSQCGGGYTTLADGRAFLFHLTLEDQKKLMQYHCEFMSKDRTHKTIASILSFPQCGEVMLRFSYNILRHRDPSPDVSLQPSVDDPFLKNICDKVLDFFTKDHRAIRMEKHSLLIWDNHRMLHSRTAYSEPARHLQRIWLS
jgi:alpha-ketoglutarate-dependent taurine dioxygenase